MNQYRVTATSLNVRQSPALKGTIVGVLPRGEKVEKLKVEQKWFYIRCGALEGWCYSSYLEPAAPVVKTTLITYKITSDSNGKLDALALNDTNQLEIRVFGNAQAQHAVVVARLDNLGKGASGAAVQNLKLMLGL